MNDTLTKAVPTLFLIFSIIMQSQANLTTDIETATGGHSRVAWAKSGRIFGIDTRDNKGIRQIMGEAKSIERLDISPDGEQIVYTHERSSCQIWSVKWDGTGNVKLKDGALTSVWRDQSSGIDYVLYIEKFDDGTKPIKKFPINNPLSSSTVLNEPVGWCFFNLSADGNFGGIEYNTYGNIGVFDMKAATYKSYFKGEFGCQCQIAPDNSYFFLGLTDYNGSHPNYTVWKNGGTKVNTFSPPKKSCGHPRWVLNQTKSRSIVIVSPDEIGDVYVIKHSDDMSTVQSTIQVTTGSGCQWPAAWVATGATATKNSSYVTKPINYTHPISNDESITLQGRTLTKSLQGSYSGLKIGLTSQDIQFNSTRSKRIK